MDLWEFEASLVYRVSSKTARATQRNPVSESERRETEGEGERRHRWWEEKRLWAGEMVQHIATKFNKLKLSLIPGTHIVVMTYSHSVE